MKEGAEAESALPQVLQKRFSAGLAAPQEGQVEGNGLPHCPQNRLLCGFCCPQWEQKITPGFPVPCGTEVSMGLLQLST